MKTPIILMVLLLLVLPLHAQEPEDLTETYENDTFSIQYPAGWVWVEGFSAGLFSFNNVGLSFEDILALTETENLEDFPEGGLLGIVALPEDIPLLFDLPDDLTADQSYQAVHEDVCESTVLDCGALTVLEWSHGDARQFTVQDSSTGLAGLWIVAEVKDGFLMTYIFAYPETLEIYQPTLIAMFQSIEYTPIFTIIADSDSAQLEFSETHEQGGITFGYAENWAVTTNSVDGLPVIASNPSRLTRDQGALLEEDEFLLRVYPLDNLSAIEAGAEPIEALTFLLDLDESQADTIEAIQLDDFPAARITERQREFVETYYAVQLSETCTVVLALMTHPASADKFAGMLPYWLETVTCQ